MATVGEAIEAKVKEYTELYEAFRGDEKFRHEAEGLALHDLIQQRYILEQAEAAVREYIGAREDQAVPHR